MLTKMYLYFQILLLTLLPFVSTFPHTIPIITHLEALTPQFHTSLLSMFPPRDGPVQDHLIIVACHGIWKGGPTLGENDDEWTLEPYQKNWNETHQWIQHIEAGVELLERSNGTAVLVFSGGETRPHGGARTEGMSYWVRSTITMFMPVSIY